MFSIKNLSFAFGVQLYVCLHICMYMYVRYVSIHMYVCEPIKRVPD